MVQNIVSTEPENGEFLSGLRMDFSQVLNSARKDVPPSTFYSFEVCVFDGYVPTESMEPTLERGSYIIGCRIYSNVETEDPFVCEDDVAAKVMIS